MKEANHEVLDRGSLPELLMNRARLSSDRKLVINAATGLVAAVSIAILRPPLWSTLSALACCLCAFGLWGILDREVTEVRPSSKRGLLIARGLVAAAGTLAAIVFGVTLFFAALGPMIS
jgi:type IV secretory pathway TrbD component